ncbi:uncharacterized protein LOC126681474 [Mercurialis annua]|uniref:uncharacterized protein LOC126681474 n=1 Tax=Mercurialis annua TaxID=3986 RepID=UPI00215E8EB0|nr:uncharacterized protein LOC126681474 [Mercurialis annua]
MSYNFNFVSWNCRGGLSFARKQRFIRSLVFNNNLSLLGIVETKKETFDDFGIRLLWPNLDFDYSFDPSIGASVGLLCIWNLKFISPSRIIKANRWISLDFVWLDIHIRFVLVYAGNCSTERASLWRDILPELNTDFLCIVVGDFNEILDPSERLNCNSFSSSMLDFSAFISASNLVESTLQGRFFTWQNSISRSKIDRCFLSPAAFTSWRNNVLKALPRSYLDHVPILFSSDVASDWGPKAFKSINAWWSNKEFFSFVANSWSDITLRLPTANLESSSNFHSLSENDISKLSCLKSDFNHLSTQIESLWHQKSRLNWNLHGDRNSKYFHTVASIHSKGNFISELYIDDAANLTTPITEEEILSTLMSCLNTAFLVLIPKFQGASDIKDFRPISLINGVFKLLSKVLANRLSQDLPSIISENQFGFIKGRSIHDCHMIATEIIHLVKRRKESVFLVKLDFMKAFDSISWQFILQMLQRMNFDTKWMSWISSFFDSAQLSILLNGCPTENFFMDKAVESLKAIFSKAASLGLLSGIHVEELEVDISILQFIDGTLLFVPNDLTMIENLLRILRCFELISGLKINYHKSSITGLNVDEFSLDKASDILHCKIEELPITYLGLPLSERAVGVKMWDPVISIFSSQLSTWRGNLLSPAGRLTLIKSVLCSLPVYYLCTFRNPQAVANSLERIMRRFLWSGDTNRRGFSKVAWSDVCVPFSSKGLNITPLRFKNQCLLMKWMWKLLVCDRSSIWFHVISNSSSINYWFDLEKSKVQHYSHLWKGIFYPCVSDQNIWSCFFGSVTMILGKGNDIRFWEDCWLSAPLKILYPDLYNLCRNKDAVVALIFDAQQQCFMNFSWARRLRVGEQQQLTSLIQQLPIIQSLHHYPDKAAWRRNKLFTAASLREVYNRSCSNYHLNSSFFMPRFWKEILPHLIQFFTWLLARDRISSNVTLVKRGVLDVTFSSCLFCSKDESGIHIVLHCHFAWHLYLWRIFSFIGFLYRMAVTVIFGNSYGFLRWSFLKRETMVFLTPEMRFSVV